MQERVGDAERRRECVMALRENAIQEHETEGWISGENIQLQVPSPAFSSFWMNCRAEGGC